MHKPFKLLTVSLCFSAILSVFSVVHAQDKKGDGKDKPGAIFHLALQLVRTDGSKVFIEQDLPDPNGQVVTQTYTVMRPVRKTVVKDGKPKVVTSYVPETRTRMVRPTIRGSMPVPKNHVFKDVNGKTIPMDELIGKLGMGQGRYVVQVTPGQKMTPELMKTFSKDTLFLHFQKPNK